MIFPRSIVPVGECLAIWKKVIGHRKQAGPCIKGRKQILFEGEMWKPSRLAYHLNIKPIPRTPVSQKTGLILHTCDQEWCVNPQHLYMGTQGQNLTDAYERHPTFRQSRILNWMGRTHTETTKQKMRYSAMKRWRR